MIILGLSEKRAFRSAPGFDADKTYARLIHVGDQLTPRVHLGNGLYDDRR